MYLIDTNIWLERLLDQARSAEVGQFLGETPSDQLLITDFAFHSIGVILTRLGRQDVLLQFVRDVFIDGAVTLVSVAPVNMQRLVTIMNQFQLDFDDAYQYAAAEQHEAVIISFDDDLDRSDRGRMTPAAVLGIK